MPKQKPEIVETQDEMFPVDDLVVVTVDDVVEAEGDERAKFSLGRQGEKQNGLMVFNFEAKTVRTVTGENGEIWFVAKDVCDALGIANHRDALTRLDGDEKGVANADTLGGMQKVITLNESGLYKLAFSSRKEEAKRFTKWVTSEVLPTIRKTGSNVAGVF